MLPALSPEERVVVNKMAYWRSAPQPGDLVVLRDPRDHKRLLVKRIKGKSEDGWLVRGDNPQSSTDSREFGPVPSNLIVGKVWFRY